MSDMETWKSIEIGYETADGCIPVRVNGGDPVLIVRNVGVWIVSENLRAEIDMLPGSHFSDREGAIAHVLACFTELCRRDAR